MKVLFLDIDGVLNCESSQWKTRGFKGIDLDKALLIKEICEKTGAKVVLSSSWRQGEYGKNLVRQHVDLIDCTPVMDGMRGYEILNWLSHHSDVEKYAIIDDDTDMLPQQKPHFFNTLFKTGLTRGIADRIIAHLS